MTYNKILVGHIKKACISAFCLWHMAAVGLYLLPDNLPWPTPTLKNITKPYMLFFSQWQEWGMFSPNPLRVVPQYSVELDELNSHEVLLRLFPEHLPWWRRAKELKILEHQNMWDVFGPLYLHSLCLELPNAANHQIRLVRNSYVLPLDLKDLEKFAASSPVMAKEITASTHCPANP